MVFPLEVYAEIIQYALHVSDEDFSCLVEDSKFGQLYHPTSNLLLVCKAWMRIATPYLYECVVLRTTGQVEALLDVMRNKTVGKELKPLVRRIRLEDHFGMMTKSLLKLFPNIPELYIQHPETEEDNIKGLCDVFSEIKPKRVIIGYAGFKHNRSNEVREYFMESLSAAIRQSWTTLNTIELNHPEPRHHYSYSLNFDTLCSALAVNPTIKGVIIKTNRWASLDGLRILRSLSASKTLEMVAFPGQSMPQAWFRDYSILRAPILTSNEDSDDENDENDELDEPNGSDGSDEPDSNQRSNRFDRKIIQRIIFFTLRSHAEQFEGEKRVSMLRQRMCDLKLVSKKFEQSVENITKLFITDLELLKEQIMKFEAAYEIISTVSCLRMAQKNAKNLLSSTFKHFSHIRKLDITGKQTYVLYQARVIDLNHLDYLTIDVEEEGTIQYNAISLFRNLKTLSLKYSCSINESKKNAKKGISRERILIPNVKTLIIKGGIHKSDMKSLLNCVFRDVEYFNCRISILCGTYCEYKASPEDCNRLYNGLPNLKTLRFDQRDEKNHVLLSRLSGSHPGVKKIIIGDTFADLEMANLDRYKRHYSDMLDTLRQIDLSGFPALQEVKLESVSYWPWRDRELKGWYHLIDSLEEKYKIKVYNDKDEPWKIRAKTRRQKSARKKNIQ